MSRRPLIGVSTSEMREASSMVTTEHGEPAQREMALGMAYLRAVALAGGMPVVLPPLEDGIVPELLERLCGICLSGGPDLDPSSYAGAEHTELGPTEPTLDQFELAVARRADELDMPILGICRGAQALNVARGGTLVQHLPELRFVGEHRQQQPGAEPTHEVTLEAGSRLAAIVGDTRLEVNSFHHQAVRRLGHGLRAVAHSPDGVIEAIEAPARSFLVGVQWHAETLVDRPEHLAVLEAFVAQAGRYRDQSLRRAA